MVKSNKIPAYRLLELGFAKEVTEGADFSNKKYPKHRSVDWTLVLNERTGLKLCVCDYYTQERAGQRWVYAEHSVELCINEEYANLPVNNYHHLQNIINVLFVRK